ncbi:serine/threonine-protein kinase [Enhygromyxa salina]|uniref:serine/threonine-protein kinase n=1 Tax=Enhygromyxa salina TaxID=215803 RepID=UPI0013FCFA3B|nr:serine/threonine-protein kinase [Enhygromyxa salina]
MSGTGTAAWTSEPPKQLVARATTARPTRPFRFGSEERADPDPALQPGEIVGERYQIVRLLGEGGMGRVYEAEHTVLRRRVALKLLRRDARESPENLARFQQEALAASRIRTPEIVEIVDFANHVGVAGPQTYMIMELLAGQSFEAWLEQEGRLDHALELLAQLCEGLAAAHRAGVIHRDIKPANVFCCAPGPQLKILDFGIAKITEGGQGVQTQQGSLLGTPYYLAPERVTGAQLTAAADIYSVGVILYELLTGNVPFTAPSFVGILALHVHTEPLDPRQAAPDRPIPDALAALCMRLLSKDPARRPTAEALALELRAMLDAQRRALAVVRTGPRDNVAGVGADTHVLPEVEAGQSISDRPTAAPSIDAPVRALAVATTAGSNKRAGTSIGHVAASTSTSRVVVAGDEPRWEAQRSTTTAPPTTSQGGTARRRAVLAMGAVVIVASLGVAWIVVGGGEQPSREPAAEAAKAPPIEVSGASEQSNPAPPNVDVDQPTAELPRDVREAEPAVATVEPKSPDPAAISPEPDPKPAPKPEPKPAPKPEPKQTDPKPAPKPDPVAPEPPPPDPAPPKPDPKPSDAKPDPDLPTIKDDVYD